MKIAICSITDSGIVRVRSELILKLLSLGHSIVVCTPKGECEKQLIDLGCSFVPIKIKSHGKNPFADYSLYRRYLRVLKTIRPDLVFTFTTKPNIYCNLACKKLRIPSIVNITGMGVAFQSNKALSFLMRVLYKKAFSSRFIKTVFFQNSFSFNYFVNHKIGNCNTFRQIPGSGVNLQKFALLEYPTNTQDIHFLFVARIMKEKGIINYIEAAKAIRTKHRNAYFHVLGSCDEKLKQYVKTENDQGTIIYHGRVNNMIDYQKISSCTIHPSYYPEGMSNVILEAAACGRPVITTNHPGCREGISDGITGLLFEPQPQ